MKTDFLLINPPCRAAYLVPIGLGYIASVIKKEGYSVKILDINALKLSDEEVRETIKKLEFDIAGIGGLTPTYKYVKWLADTIKTYKPDVTVVAGNMVATAHPELLLRNSRVDIAVIDEGEATIRELVPAILNKKDFSEIDGIFYKSKDNEILKTSPRKRILDLDSLPFPAWDLFPMEIYLDNPMQARTMVVSAVRGCPYECTFCSHPFGRRVTFRSAGSIVEEIKELKERYNIKMTGFSDDLFLINRKLVLEFCDRMIAEKVNIEWGCAARVNLVDDSLLRNMRLAGCVELGYGFESGSQAMLDRMKKRVTVKQAEEAVKVTRRAGMKITGSFILGMPGETESTIKETLDFIKRTRLPMRRFFYATPYPKTELYEFAKQLRRLPADEDKYVESLGEMRLTFLVNLTDFPDKKLVSLKESAEKIAKRNLSFRFKFEEFMRDWLRRFTVIRLSLKDSGVLVTIKKIFLRIQYKLIKNRNLK